MTRVLLIIIAVIVTVLVGTGLLASHYRDNAIGYKAQRDKATDALKRATETIFDMQLLRRDAAALDAKYTKELANAKAENDALQRKLDNDGRVLVKGKCSVSAKTGAARTSGVVDDAAIELSSVAGRNVLSLRSGIVSDQSKIKYLQDYIRRFVHNRDKK